MARDFNNSMNELPAMPSSYWAILLRNTKTHPDSIASSRSTAVPFNRSHGKAVKPFSVTSKASTAWKNAAISQ
jgi:hypothetical protein